LDEISKRIVHLNATSKRLQGRVGDQHAEVVEAHHDHLMWLHDQLPIVVERFKPFLALDHSSKRQRWGVKMALENASQNATDPAQQAAVDKLIEQAIAIHSAVYSNAIAYSNVIIVAGYGAIFAIWGFTKDYLAPWNAQLVACLLVSSIGVYVAFEIYKMIIIGFSIMSFNRVLRPNMGVEAVQKAIDDHNKGDQRRSVSFGRVWLPVLILTISTGFGAGGLLAWNFIANLVAGLPPQP